MNWDSIDWKALERLRAAFLEGTAGQADYWQSESDLASYDATFAQRIGWKWDYVLKELKQRGWMPAPSALVDWGCGSGIAHRAFLDHFGAGGISELQLNDRSALAVRFAERRAKEKYPELKVTPALPADAPQHGTLLISHVLTELQPAQVESLANFATNFTSVIWVEPGTYEASLTLIAVRERLRGKLNVIAPCPHQERCGILAPGNESHWCHHFAEPPLEVFTDGNWAKFGEMAGVDLRSLPLSFLALDRRPALALAPGTTRIIGRPRFYKPYAALLGCDATGVSEKQITKRRLPEAFRKLKRGECASLQIWHCEGDEVVATQPFKKPD